ncbi:MAG: flavodoxin-dependent (E)-4-hydroxy-3-methylbut-2-enyl-diphosphate synthase [Candidatus Improbicoccus pseudotrichonymphae]|uniref:4-hydroxy-3-methylbut-2-en-1-yl diphosphate synthase (flavodoxin) n=1 Tax=Candidatus Improbicoccus pseudotrichonymphae TaxID=3033792 RepID=A0AA48HYB5_9FIRM|nr:MAG: flavodoxin-dependent (E)-4-hydroxy-3-methylbut-2-enyl-diphosphate synthase [Candidatus Improbicoccus pseudotrichonymphae]
MFKIIRRKAQEIKIKDTILGSDKKIAVQSMLKIKPSDIDGNVSQACELEKAGCDIVRVAIPTKEDAKLIYKIKNKVNIPVVADIHFDYKIALESIDAGADKIRINPHNIDKKHFKKIADTCNFKNIPIRLGFNLGSVMRRSKNADSDLVNAAIKNIRIFEDLNFRNIVVSLKSSSVLETIGAYEKIAKKCDYPLHVGITEAGLENTGIVKSSVAIGHLLLKGIGDTIRISLSGDPIKEVKTGISILQSLNLYEKRIEIISCPTCGRTTIDVINLTKKIESLVKNIKKNIKIAVMGCPVNGPGESANADIGISGASGMGYIFKKGKLIKKTTEDKLIESLLKEIATI